MQKQSFENYFEILPEIIPLPKNSTIFYDKTTITLPIKPSSSIHYHNKLEIGICHKGSGVFYNNLTRECLNPGDITIVFPGESHYSHSLTPSEPCICNFLFVDVMPNLFSLFKENKSGINLLSRAQSYNIPLVIRKQELPQAYNILYSMINDVLAHHQNIEFLTSLHLTEFLIKIPSFFDLKDINANSIEKDSDDIIFIAETFISSNYNKPITISQLCEICRLSESQLRRKFKKTFGSSPLTYLHKLRCDIGSQLLMHTNMPINQISQKLGYLDSSEFYKHFQALFNCSPSNYRAQKTVCRDNKSSLPEG